MIRANTISWESLSVEVAFGLIHCDISVEINLLFGILNLLKKKTKGGSKYLLVIKHFLSQNISHLL